MSWSSGREGGRSWSALMPGLGRDSDLPGFEQRLQVGNGYWPSAGHSFDELRLRPVDLIRDGELHRTVRGLKHDGAASRGPRP